MKKIMMNKGISTPTHSHTKLYTHTHKSHMHRLSAAQSPMYSRLAPIAFHRFVVSLFAPRFIVVVDFIAFSYAAQWRSVARGAQGVMNDLEWMQECMFFTLFLQYTSPSIFTICPPYTYCQRRPCSLCLQITNICTMCMLSMHT